MSIISIVLNFSEKVRKIKKMDTRPTDFLPSINAQVLYYTASLYCLIYFDKALHPHMNITIAFFFQNSHVRETSL